jgi:hypothetical protein
MTADDDELDDLESDEPHDGLPAWDINVEELN